MPRLVAIVLALLLSLTTFSSALPQSATPIASPAAMPVDDLTGAAPLPLAGQRLADFEAFIAATMAACPVPGASVAVVQNGEVVYLNGFGVRERDRAAPVTADTLFRIGSVTKSMTSLLAATLVDDGVVSWETPLVDLLPGFALSDPERTTSVTLADIFSAATGLPRRDMELILNADTMTPEAILASVATLPLTAPQGEQFQYSNQAFVLGGFAAAIAAGASPDDPLTGYAHALQDRVFNPIGMDRSTLDLGEVLAGGNYAIPHAANLEAEPVPLSLLREDRFTAAVAPAGAVWSSARDMARYVQTELANGVAPDGNRVVSAENLHRTWQAGVAVPPIPNIPEIMTRGMAHYGLGWLSGDYGGLELISHSGGTYGFASEVAFLPEADLGIAVLANDSGCGALLGFATQYRLFELVFAQEPAIQAEIDALVAAAREQMAAGLPVGAIDPAVVTPLLGSYQNDALGEVTLSLRNGELLLDAGELRSRLLPLIEEPGGEQRYIAIDPPLVSLPGAIAFVESGGERPELVFTMLGDDVEEPLIYHFTPIGEDAAAVATPAA